MDISPSIRSSAPRPLNHRFIKTEPALHEATQRFVESLIRDVRVSQFADLKYASTLLQKGTWYWLHGGKNGFLVIAPKSPIVWMDEQGKVSYIIQMRVSKEILETGAVFLASLQLIDCKLVIEDVRNINGKNIEDQPFSKRWETLLDFYRNSYICDTALQGGLAIEPAVYYPLESAKEWNDDTPIIMIAQGDTYRKRVRVQIRDKDVVRDIVSRKYPPTREPSQLVKNKAIQIKKRPATAPTTALPAPANAPANATSTAAKEHAIPNETYVVPSKEYPDTYLLMINGEEKGFAAVQGMSLSRSLRDMSKTMSKIKVNVAWNAEFSSHEIVSVA